MVSRSVLLAVVIATLLSSVRVASGCYSDYDCDNNNICCNGYCQDQYTTCFCTYDSDCPGFGDQYCCDGYCLYDENCGYLDPGALAGIIIGTIFFCIIAVFFGLCICGFCCAAGPFRNRARNTAGRTYGATTTTVVSTSAATNPSYPQYPPMVQPGQYPPQYQQQPAYYQGPPQYSQAPGSGYQSMPAYQPPPPYVTENPQKAGYEYEAPPAVNPNI